MHIQELQNRCNALIENLGRVLQTADLNVEFFHVPLWKHYYHALYWFDHWFAGPEQFLGAPFHVPGLENIDIPCDQTVSKEQLQQYYDTVAEKSRRYLDGLTEQSLLTEHMLSEPVRNTDRLGLIHGQIQHVSLHLGNINAITIQNTGRWPRMKQRMDEASDLYE